MQCDLVIPHTAAHKERVNASKPKILFPFGLNVPSVDRASQDNYRYIYCWKFLRAKALLSKAIKSSSESQLKIIQGFAVTLEWRTMPNPPLQTIHSARPDRSRSTKEQIQSQESRLHLVLHSQIDPLDRDVQRSGPLLGISKGITNAKFDTAEATKCRGLVRFSPIC